MIDKMKYSVAIGALMVFAVAASVAHAATPQSKNTPANQVVYQATNEANKEARALKREALRNPDATQTVTVSEETAIEPTVAGDTVTYTKVKETVGSRQEIRQNGEKIDPAQVKRQGKGNNYIQRSANNWTDETWTNDLDTKDVVNVEDRHIETTVVKETMYSNLNR